MQKSSKALIALAVLFTLAGYLFSLNFHEVEPGVFYRSGQLSKTELNLILPSYHIKTVINLRGVNESADWYRDEVEVTSKLGVKLINISMNSREIPDRAGTLRLLEAYHTAEAPILIHCLSGADRSGEASALYEMAILGKSKDQALQMLSAKFHHFDFFRPAKRYFIEIYQGEDWLRKAYHPCNGEFKFYDTKSPECLRGDG